MRLGLPRDLIITNNPLALPLLLLLLPVVVQAAAQFGSLPRPQTTRVGEVESLQSWFSLVTDGTTNVCSLTFTSDLVTIINSEVACKVFDGPDNSASNNSTISTQSWTFYHTIGSALYRADCILTLAVGSHTSTVLQLSVCLSASCGGGGAGGGGGDTICLSSPHQHNYPTSSASQQSSSPEGFVFAIAGASSSSEQQPATTTTASNGPQVEAVEAEQSSASVQSFLSSAPEGFVMAFTPKQSSSSVSAFSSTAEGFVFAFANHKQSSQQSN